MKTKLEEEKYITNEINDPAITQKFNSKGQEIPLKENSIKSSDQLNKIISEQEETKSKLKNEAKAWEMDLGLDNIIGCDASKEPEVEEKPKQNIKAPPKKKKNIQQCIKEKQPPKFENKGKKNKKK